MRAPLLLAVALAAAPAGAHEIGKTQATALFAADGTYQVDIVADPDALLTKLEVFGDRPLTGASSRADRDRRIAALEAVFLDRVILRFDGVPVHPRFEYLPASPPNDRVQAASIVRLSGRLPGVPQEATFAYGLALGAYPLHARVGDSPVQTLWLEGPEPSPPISLRALPQPATSGPVAWPYFIAQAALLALAFMAGLYLTVRRAFGG